MKRTSLLSGMFLVLVAALGAQPKVTSLQNNYSYAIPGTPSYGIAQGSIFVIWGSGMGPTNLVAQGFNPSLSRNPSGVSIKVTVGGTTTEAIPYYVSAGQSAAILPSATPVGDGTITVTYGGQTSAPAPIHVVQSAFGILTMNGAGMGMAAVYDADYHFISQTNAANPGQTVMFWGTGLGPDPRDETNLLTGAQPLSWPLEFYIGGKLATVAYRARSAFPGLDQINVTIPSGVSGCSVSAVAKTGANVSNFTTIPVATNGRTCSDATQLSSDDVTSISGKQTINMGSLSLGKTTTVSPSISVGGITIPGSTTTTDSADAMFVRYTAFDYSAYAGMSRPSLGSCVVSTYTSSSMPSAPMQKVLAAGNISLTLPDNSTKQLAYDGAFGAYGLTGSSATAATPLFIPAAGGAFRFAGTGGTDVGSFSAPFNMAAPLVWSNMSGITTVNRSQNLDVTWTGGAANSWVVITGMSMLSSPTMVSFFSCVENQSAGHFTIPSMVLSSMLASAAGPGGVNIPTGQLSVSNYQPPVKFTAQGLDVGMVSAYAGTGISVNYQ